MEFFKLKSCIFIFVDASFKAFALVFWCDTSDGNCIMQIKRASMKCKHLYKIVLSCIEFNTFKGNVQRIKKHVAGWLSQSCEQLFLVSDV